MHTRRGPWWKRGFPGVWITSAGGGGLATVSTNSTLTGNGTSGTPIGIAGVPVPWAQFGDIFAGAFSWGGANTTFLYGFVLTCPYSVGHLGIDIGTADATGLYDLGVYNAAGTLLLDIGAQHLPNTGTRLFAVSGGAKTIGPGLFGFAVTGNATTATISFSSNAYFPYASGTGGASSGGALPATATIPVIATTQDGPWFVLTS